MCKTINVSYIDNYAYIVERNKIRKGDKMKICFSQTGNRTPAAAVRAPNPNHSTIWDVLTNTTKKRQNQLGRHIVMPL